MMKQIGNAESPVQGSKRAISEGDMCCWTAGFNYSNRPIFPFAVHMRRKISAMGGNNWKLNNHGAAARAT